ncbi:MAG TPA: peptidylprolyl isomerase [Candidatus Eisenbacteria bacterium]|nr:peptidylprolyl isomerase [Candidatus Eisenbacteria bacterium]
MGRIPKLLREPLLHFLLLGGALFLLHAWRSGSVSAPAGPSGAQAARIVVTQDDIARMERQFVATWQRPPGEEERRGLIEDFVRNEIYCREAIAIGLDRDDDVIRRRLRTKMEFLYEDVANWAEPTDDELRTFMLKHAEKYRTEPSVAFRQVFVSMAKRGASGESEARRLLARLTAGVDPNSVGDATMLEPEFPLSPLSDIRAQFGDEFAKALPTLAPGRWTGPIRSTYGLHLVLVSRRDDGALPEFGEIRDAVKRDWTIEKQSQVKDAAYAKLRERYTVAVETPTTTTPSTASAGDLGASAR